MANFKSLLLTATIVAGAVASPAFAQQKPLPAPSTADGALHGAGASSVPNIVTRNFNCVGTTDNKRGASSSATALTTLTQGKFLGTPPIDCSVDADAMQSNIQGKYVSTGSGFGRTIWRDFGNDFQGGTGASATATSAIFNPHVTAPDVWSNVQFAFSDAPLTATDIATYNTRAAPTAGAAIQFPLFLLPVAIAYTAEYGKNATGASMVFNAKGKGIAVNGTPVAAIMLSKAAYCGIFNGTILNWNDPALKRLNGNTELFDPLTDSSTRWLADGVPIRLVGRLDRSGTTDIFTRHLAAVCNPLSAPGLPAVTNAKGVVTQPAVLTFVDANNKFRQAAESLPYATSTGVDFRSVRGDTSYRINNTASPSTTLSGTTNSVSGDYFNGTAIVNIGTGSAAFPSAAGSTSMPNGKVGSGLFLLGDGNPRVAQAVTLAPDYTLNGVTLNGKVAYLSADFINPSVDSFPGLVAAVLQVGTSATAYATPTATNANKALGTIAPPESDATTGLYLAGDSRLVRPLTGSTLVPATRKNPLAWADVLYADKANTLAAPSLGYPMTGTTQILLYTCYNGGNREAMVNHLGYVLGQFTKTGTGAVAPSGLLNGTVATTPGVIFQSNVGVVPPTWVKAIVTTFLSNSADAGALNLWIQDRLLPVYQTAAPAVIYGVTLGVPATATKPIGTIKTPAKLNVMTATNPNSACTTPAVIGTGTAAAPQFPAVVLKTGA